MTEVLPMALVVLAGTYFIVLAGLSLFAPDRANRFLLGFAASPGKHYAEMAGRLLVGGALILQAPRMSFPGAFNLFGWALVVTTACLLVVPWQWHRRFAERVVPGATHYIALMGLVSLALGVLILAAVLRGNLG